MMAKRLRGACSEVDNKVMVEGEAREHQCSIDRISMLPDEVLLLLLSLLTLKELAATSLLSRRWRYLWTLIPRLDFDGIKSLLKIEMAEDSKLVADEERSNYVRWVDHVVALRTSCTIEDFRVYFNLTRAYEKYIDKWVKYALTRKVKRLVLDLTDDGGVTCWYDDRYTFPYKYLPKNMENCSNGLQLCSVRHCNSIHFQYLEKISMNHVNVNGEAVEFFLCNCPLLEHLSVTHSWDLLTLKIIAPSPSFKHLEIISCFNLNSVEIRDANLVYLKYRGRLIQQFILENVPLLVQISLGDTLSHRFKYRDFLLLFSSILPQLEKFELYISCDVYFEDIGMFFSGVKMSNLKQLIVNTYSADSFLPLTNIISASTCLEIFVLKTTRYGPKFVRRKLKKTAVRSYPRLKEVKFLGYCGLMCDLELMMHLLKSAAALDKIVIDPCINCTNSYDHFWKYNCEFKDEIIEGEMKSRTRANKQLPKRVPPRINLQIL